MKEFPAKANLADEPIEASRRVEIPVARTRELLPLHLPIVAPKKVRREWREREKGAEKRLETEEIARHKMVNEILAKQKLSKEKLQRLPKERRVTEKSAKQQVLMREKLHAQKGR